MASVDVVSSEIKSGAQYIMQQELLNANGAQIDTTTLRAGIIRSLTSMIGTIKHLRTDSAMMITSEIQSSQFNATEKQTLAECINKRVAGELQGAWAPNVKPKQRFLVPESSQHIFTHSNWKLFCSKETSLAAKIAGLVDACSMIGFDNPEQTVPADLAVVLACSHYNLDTVTSKQLFQLQLDIGTTFNATPRKNPACPPYYLFKSIEDLPQEALAAYKSEPAIRGTITCWSQVRARIASRKSSKLLRDDAVARSPSQQHIPAQQGASLQGSSQQLALAFRLGNMHAMGQISESQV